MGDISFGTFAFIFLLFFVLKIVLGYYSTKSRTSYDVNQLRADAKISDIKTAVVGSKNHKRIRTTVTFDDGYVFESFKTDRENSMFTYRINVSTATRNEIISDAFRAHQNACGAGSQPEKANTSAQTAPGKPAAAQAGNALNSPVRSASQQPKSLAEEFMDTYQQAMNKPLGGEEQAWDWIVGRIRYFKEKGLKNDALWMLEQEAAINLPQSYRQHFNDFLALAERMTPIVWACEDLLIAGKGQTAKDVADPYLDWLLAHPEKYSEGHFCVQNKEEAVLCILDGYPLTGTPTADNYTRFLVLYCRILDNILAKTEDDLAAARRTKEKLLGIARKLSPCNATVWEALAKTVIAPSEDERLYREYINKALRYSTRTGEPYGLGTVYGNLALHYATAKPELAKALCMICRRYEGSPLAAELVLSKQEVPAPANPDALLQREGIQIGFSEIVKTAQSSQK